MDIDNMCRYVCMHACKCRQVCMSHSTCTEVTRSTLGVSPYLLPSLRGGYLFVVCCCVCQDIDLWTSRESPVPTNHLAQDYRETLPHSAVCGLWGFELRSYCFVASIFPNEPPSDSGGNPSISLSFLIVPVAEARVNEPSSETRHQQRHVNKGTVYPERVKNSLPHLGTQPTSAWKLCRNTWVHRTV